MKRAVSKYLLIRPAVADDVTDLASMRLALQRHMRRRSSRLWNLSRKQSRGFPRFYRARLRSRSVHLLVVKDTRTGRAVGMAMGSIQKHDAFVPRKSGKIDDVWVQPGYRRKGLCRRLTGKLLRFFEKNRVSMVTLVYALGNSEAAGTWKRLGFVPALVGASGRLSEVKRRVQR